VVTIDQLMDGQRLDRITAEARQVQFGRVVLTVLAAVLFGVGWVVARAFGVLWLVAAWTATAVRIGWQEGRKPRPKR
jgi:uncharacterized membrane protein YedE/YeeE